MFFRTLTTAALAITLTAASARAQAVTLDQSLNPNARVRVHLSPTRPAEQTIRGPSRIRVGLFAGVRSDSISLIDTWGRTMLTYSMTDVSSVEKSVANGRHVLRGVAIGLLVGAGLGAVIGASSYSPCRQHGYWDCATATSSRDAAAKRYGLLGGIVGGGLGFAVGFNQRNERWVTVTPR